MITTFGLQALNQMYLMLVLFIITVTCLTMHSFIVQLIFTQVSSFLILILVVLLLFWNQAGKEQLLNEQKQALPSILNDKLSTITLSEIVKDWSNVKCREIQNTAMKLTSLFPIYLSVQNLRDLKPYRFLQELFHQSGSYYDWVSAIVRDDWTNCEKIIKHLKNQKNICFKVLMA